MHDVGGFRRQQLLWQAEQKAAIPGELDGGAFFGGELRAALLAHFAGQQVLADHPGRHLVDLRHRHAVDRFVPLVGLLERVIADHRVHQADHGGGFEAGAVPVQGTGQGGDGEEAGRLVDPPSCPLAREGAGQGHRQRGIGVGERRDERSAGNEGCQQRRGDAFLPSAFAYQVEVDPLRSGFHGGDERCELGGRLGHRLDALAARPLSMSISWVTLCVFISAA